MLSDPIPQLRQQFAATSSTMNQRSMLACMLLLVVVTLITYANSLGNGFVWDDHQILVVQGETRQFPSIAQVFTSVDTVFHDERVPYYRPLHRFIHLLELRFFGLNPLPFHGVSILLHTANALLLFRLASLLLGGTFPALVAALLFAVHPVNSEGVNFITSRQNMWALFFTLSAALVFLGPWQEKRPWRPFLAAILFFGGLCCKETALMPLVFLAMALLVAPPLPPASRWRSLLSLTPFALALLIYGALRLSAIPGTAGLGGVAAKTTLIERLGYNLYVLPKYACNLILPVRLSAFYTVPDHVPWGEPTILAGWLLLAALLFYTVRHRSWFQMLVLLWLLINWLPISNLIQIPSAPMADRYLYLPAVSIWLLAGFVAEQCHARLGRNRVVPGVVVLVVTLFGLLSIQRNQVWKNDITLFTSIARAEPQAGNAGYNLGKALFEAGRTAEAQREWQRTIQLEPGHSKTLNCLGNLALSSNDLALAEQYYRRSVTSDPGNAEAHYNLALIYEQQGRYGETRQELELFLRRVPPEYGDLIPEVQRKLMILPRPTP